MMGWGPWGVPVLGFWWIFPVVGLAICLMFFVMMARAVSGGGRFMCMGPHRDDGEETARLRRELEELREQMKKQGAAR